MTRFDVDEIRESTMALFQLSGLDSVYKFYYDETNNPRKYYLKKDGVNVTEQANFVLGGVMHNGKESKSDFSLLLKKLNLPKTINEVKLKHLATGDFENCLKSKRLQFFLKWLLDSDLYIHYTNLDLFYYSIVDIVDSIIVNSQILKHVDMDFVNALKDDLYKLAVLEKDKFLKLLFLYNYPNIKKEKINDFIRSLIEIIDKYDRIPAFHVGLTSIKQLLKQSLKSQELYFIMGERDYILIDNFSMFYLRPIYLFNNSEHLFDEETYIQKILEDIELYDHNSKMDNYKFINSKNNNFIQVSDVIVGLLGKCFTYTNRATFNEIRTLKSNLNPIQRENLKLIIELRDSSDLQNKALLLSISSNQEKRKIELLLGS